MRIIFKHNIQITAISLMLRLNVRSDWFIIQSVKRDGI